MMSPARKRFLGWLWTGTLGGLAMAGLLLMVMQPEHMTSWLVGLLMMLLGLVGMTFQFLFRMRRKR